MLVFISEKDMSGNCRSMPFRSVPECAPFHKKAVWSGSNGVRSIYEVPFRSLLLIHETDEYASRVLGGSAPQTPRPASTVPCLRVPFQGELRSVPCFGVPFRKLAEKAVPFRSLHIPALLFMPCDYTELAPPPKNLAENDVPFRSLHIPEMFRSRDINF